MKTGDIGFNVGVLTGALIAGLFATTFNTQTTKLLSPTPIPSPGPLPTPEFKYGEKVILHDNTGFNVDKFVYIDMYFEKNNNYWVCFTKTPGGYLVDCVENYYPTERYSLKKL
jgi:hypothetical protein